MKKEKYTPMPLIRECVKCQSLHNANRGIGNWKSLCEGCVE